jgi:hypothetical protein
VEFSMRGKNFLLLSVIMAFAAGQPAAAHHMMEGKAALTTGIAFITEKVTNPVTPRLAGAVVAGVGIAVLAGRILPG